MRRIPSPNASEPRRSDKSVGKVDTIHSLDDASPMRAARDYAGIPTSELARIFHQHWHRDLRAFATRIDMDDRQLSKLVVTQDYPFTGWTTVERIFEGLGLNSSMLLLHGEIHEVPARDSQNAARQIAEDMYFALCIPEPDAADMDALVDSLLEMRRELCAPTVHQKRLIDRDAQRNAQRADRKKNNQSVA